MGFLGALMVKNLSVSAGGSGDLGSFDPWVSQICWSRQGRPPPVVLPGELHGQRSLVGYSVWGLQGTDTTGATEHAHCHGCTIICVVISLCLTSPYLPLSTVDRKQKSISLLTIATGTSLAAQLDETLSFQCRGSGLIPGRGTKILHVVQCGQKLKKKKKIIATSTFSASEL